MKERPILFSGPMIRAILEGRKTQTRRVVKPFPFAEGWERWNKLSSDKQRPCPYGQPGDRLWVREAWAVYEDIIHYRADDEIEGPWRPSIHMPRWASRITLEVTDVRVERLQDISEGDSQREGCERPILQDMGPGLHPYTGDYRDAFQSLWQSINGPESWDANPWVWVVEFKRI